MHEKCPQNTFGREAHYVLNPNLDMSFGHAPFLKGWSKVCVV